MSLHCPATLIVARHEGDSRVLAKRLRDRRVAAVYSGSARDAALTGRAVAGALGAVSATLPGLDTGPGVLPVSVEETLWRHRAELRSLADLHRGETVLVLAQVHPSADWVSHEIEIGDDGSRLLT